MKTTSLLVCFIALTLMPAFVFAAGEKKNAEEIFQKGIKVAEARGDMMPQKKMEARLLQLSSETS